MSIGKPTIGNRVDVMHKGPSGKQLFVNGVEIESVREMTVCMKQNDIQTVTITFPVSELKGVDHE